MKNDLLLIKKILLYAEKNFHPSKDLIISFDDYSNEEVSYCIKKLDELGYVDALNLTSSSGIEYRINDITAYGWQLIEKIKEVNDKDLVSNKIDLDTIFYSSNKNSENKITVASHKPNEYIVAIISGIVVAIVVLFLLTPMKEWISTEKKVLPIFSKNDSTAVLKNNTQNSDNKSPIVKQNNKNSAYGEEGNKIIPSGLNTEQIRIKIMERLRENDVDSAISLFKSLPEGADREEECVHIFNYCINNGKLDKAEKLIKYFHSPDKKAEAIQLLSSEQIK